MHYFSSSLQGAHYTDSTLLAFCIFNDQSAPKFSPFLTYLCANSVLFFFPSKQLVNHSSKLFSSTLNVPGLLRKCQHPQWNPAREISSRAKVQNCTKLLCIFLGIFSLFILTFLLQIYQLLTILRCDYNNFDNRNRLEDIFILWVLAESLQNKLERSVVISPACSEVRCIFGRERSHSLYDALQFPLRFGKRRGEPGSYEGGGDWLYYIGCVELHHYNIPEGGGPQLL